MTDGIAGGTISLTSGGRRDRGSAERALVWMAGALVLLASGFALGYGFGHSGSGSAAAPAAPRPKTAHEKLVDELKAAAKVPPPSVSATTVPPTTVPPRSSSAGWVILNRQIQSLDLQRQAQARCRQLLAGGPVTGLHCAEHRTSAGPKRSPGGSSSLRS